MFYASVSKTNGTVTAIKGVNKAFMFKSVFHGKVAVPPIIAKVSIAAVGASAVKKVLWITLEDFLKA